MTTRTIVTSQPDVACDVCERRLLRGELPDVFIAAGRRLTVCELCAPRATHEGWMRESDAPSIDLPPARPRRGRSLVERLLGTARQRPQDPPGEQSADGEQGYELLPARSRGRRGERSVRPQAGDDWQDPLPVDTEADSVPAEPVALEPSYLQSAVELFNSSEYPRRIAGVARSLGAPEVSVRSAEHLESVVLVVVAWELCWYRYEVDLSGGLSEISVREQGTELSELARDDRLVNAQALESGALALVSV
jgi:hypothetical protein